MRPTLSESRLMAHGFRAMPTGVRVLLAYGFVLLVLLAISLPLVVQQAVEAPISLLGLLWMLLLAYLIFTITLILQRKQAAWGLSIGLATLSLPLVPMLLLWGGALAAVLGLAVSTLLFLSLRGRGVRTWFSEP